MGWPKGCVASAKRKESVNFYDELVAALNTPHYTYLWVVSGKKPTQPKKSLRKAFSRMPTKPVAGEALNRHLQHTNTKYAVGRSHV